MKTINLALIAASTLCLVLNSGCVAVVAGGAGAGTVAYVKGELTELVTASKEDTIQAVRKAIAELQFTLKEDKVDKHSGRFVAVNAKDEKIKIAVDYLTTDSTKIGVRVGIFGDKLYAQSILNEIKAQL